MTRLAVLVAAWILGPVAALQAETIRIATYDTELRRDGPGLLLRDIERGDAQAEAAAQVIAHARPDILVLQSVDWDYDGRALEALAKVIADAGQDYPHRYAKRSNRGAATGLDMNGDGRLGDAEDAQAFGAFSGQGGMALLSRYPIATDAIVTFDNMLWSDLPGAEVPVHPDGTPFPSPEAQAVQRLSSGGHWVVPIDIDENVRLTVLTYHASPPVFDGPEDRNGLRNRDETRLWSLLLGGGLGPRPVAPFVIAGNANLDPEQGEGQRETIRDLLASPMLQDPEPKGAAHDNATVDWSARGPGRLRVSYVLPSRDLAVSASGIVWPMTGPLAETVETASRHRLVWVDITLP
ncbi:MAG: endonuclease/exonuclease/phosphatase family protein [Pseudomonadota bacterium]